MEEAMKRLVDWVAGRELNGDGGGADHDFNGQCYVQEESSSSNPTFRVFSRDAYGRKAGEKWMPALLTDKVPHRLIVR